MARAKTPRDLDALFHTLADEFPEAIASLLGLPPEAGYRASSPELKQAAGRCDVLLAPESNPEAPHALVELQLRHDPDAERSLLRKVVLYARSIDYRAPIDAFIIHGSAAIRRAALAADVPSGRGIVVRFRPRRIVLPTRGTLPRSSRVATVLLPLLSSRSAVERRLPEWYAELWTEPDPVRRTRLIEYLIRLATTRHRLTYEEMEAMASRIAYPELSPWDSLCEEIREQGREQGREQARERGQERVRASIRRIVRERFGRRPRWLVALRAIVDDAALDEILVTAATAGDNDDLREVIERLVPAAPKSASRRRPSRRRGGRAPKRG